MDEDEAKSIAHAQVLETFNKTMDLIDEKGEGFCDCGHAQLVSELLTFACYALAVASAKPSNLEEAIISSEYASDIFNLLGDMNDTASIVYTGYEEQGINKR